jgi:uncharacterized paraquat-inducible protein A
MQQGLQSCEGCGLLSSPAPGEEEGRCPRCDEELAFRMLAVESFDPRLIWDSVV